MNTLILLIIFIFVGWYSIKQVHPYEAEEEEEEEQQYQEKKYNRKRRKNGKKNR